MLDYQQMEVIQKYLMRVYVHCVILMTLDIGYHVMPVICGTTCLVLDFLTPSQQYKNGGVKAVTIEQSICQNINM